MIIKIIIIKYVKMQGFLKEYDYVWDTGMEGNYAYGFNGKLLKNNLENYLRHFFCNFEEIEAPIISEKKLLIQVIGTNFAIQ